MVDTKSFPQWANYVLGGTAGVLATTCVQPMDLVKTRMQLSGEGSSQKLYKSSFDALVKITKQEGFFKLYKGYTSGVLRQITYTTTRLGVFTNCMNWVRARNNGENPSFLQKMACGMIGGACGAVVGNPAEVSLIRCSADNRLPPEQRRGYTNCFQAIYRIVKEEGLKTLWKGTSATVVRAVVLNPAQLGGYAQAKELYYEKWHLFKTDGLGLYIASSLTSGLFCSFVSLPVDIVKTRLQMAKPGEYSGAYDCLKVLMKNEGVFALWKGFTPYFLRIGPHTIFTFLFLEQLNKLFATYYMKQ